MTKTKPQMSMPSTPQQEARALAADARRRQARTQAREGASGMARMTGGLRVGQKLALVSLLFGVPVAALSTALAVQQQNEVGKLQRQQLGVPYVQVATDLVHDIQSFSRAALLARLSGNNADLGRATAAVDATLAKYTRTVKSDPLYAKGAALADVTRAWQALKGQATRLPAADLLERTSSLADGFLLPGIDRVSNDVGLELNANRAEYYLQSYLVNQVPDLALQIGEAQLIALRFGRDRSVGAEERKDMIKVAGEAESFLEETEHRYEFVIGGDPALKQRLEPKFLALQAATTPYFAALDRIAGGQQVANVDALAQTTVARLRDFTDASASALTDLLNATEQVKARQQRLTLLGVGLALLTALVLLTLIVRGITTSLARLATASRRVATGDLNVQVPVTSRDEVGIVTGAFNGAVAQLRENEVNNAAEREQAQQLQSNIGQFLDVTMDIADGDLTKRGKVTEDVLGNVVDSINLMVDELAQVLAGVQQASQSVTGGAQAMLTTTGEIAQGADLTASQAQQVNAQVQGVTSAIREMAQSAAASAEAARQALTASEQGQQAVQGTLDGMQNIRREVQGVSKRVKSLGDRSLEIQDIVETISRISRQTNLLALNAAIEAAGAGEAGSRFAIVADEVRKLAESSAQATGRISGLIKSVQQEIQEVVASVEDGTREVEAGYRVAGSAGERLRELGELAQQSAQLAVQIEDATKVQVAGVEQVGGAVQQIAQIAGQSRAQVAQGRTAAEQLQQLAERLSAQLSRFRLSN